MGRLFYDAPALRWPQDDPALDVPGDIVGWRELVSGRCYRPLYHMSCDPESFWSRGTVLRYNLQFKNSGCAPYLSFTVVRVTPSTSKRQRLREYRNPARTVNGHTNDTVKFETAFQFDKIGR